MRAQLLAKTVFNTSIIASILRSVNITPAGVTDNDIATALTKAKLSGFPIELFTYAFSVKLTSQELIAFRENTRLVVFSVGEDVILSGSLQQWKSAIEYKISALDSIMREFNAFFSNLHQNTWTTQNGQLRIT